MSPIVTIDLITRPEHLVEFLAQYIDEGDLGFRYIAKYNEKLYPEFPAVHVMAGPTSKEFHGTHTFAVTLRADIYVMHALFTDDYQTRSYNDMVLATNLVEYLETPIPPSAGLDLGERIVVGWVENEIPGVNPPRSTISDAVISTRLSYQAITETRFK